MHPATKFFSLFVLFALATGNAIASDAKTIRIEPRAFYGATVSIESGVRVFRPLPSASHVIINPNQTPLHLTIKDVTERRYSTSRNYFYGTGGGSGRRVVGGALPYGFFGDYRGRHKSGRHPGRRPGKPGGRPGGRR